MKAPSLVVAGDGTQAAMIEEDHVTVIDLATMRARAEIGLPGAIADTDVVLAGVPARLVVVTRAPAETRLFVVDPAGPEKVGEATTRANMRLGAIAGDHVLLIGATTALVDLRYLDRPPTTLPVRGAVTAAGAMGDTNLVLVMAGALEEWDAATRSPVKRLRLEKPLDVHLIGGSERRIWMVVKAAPQRIEVLDSRTKSSRVIEVPEAIERLHVHPYLDVLIAVGATSAFVVRPDRDQVTRVPGGPFHDCVWAGNQVLVWPVDAYPHLIASPIELSPNASDDDDDDVAPAPLVPAENVPAAVRAEVASQNLRSPVATPTFSERLASWRSSLDDARKSSTSALPIAETPADTTAQILERRGVGGWRTEITTWARAILGRSNRPMPFIDPAILDELLVRFEVALEVRPAIVLLYAAHLLGGDGVARADLASVIDWRWDALATGAIATCPLVRTKKDRLHLVREASAALDEAPPRRGTLVGHATSEGGASAGETTNGHGPTGDERTGNERTALVVPASVDVSAIAAWGEKLAAAPLFVANARGHARLDRFVLEARIRGAVPVVPDDATAAAYGLAIAARWPGLGVA
ncbi:MAG: hypothetical protein ACKV2T_18880 [Kofleriaceae bacterium]